jgi:hypothetical protein
MSLLTDIAAKGNALTDYAIQAIKVDLLFAMRTVSMPHPMFDADHPGTIYPVMVMVVPMVHPLPAWTSGMIRSLQSAKTA